MHGRAQLLGGTVQLFGFVGAPFSVVAVWARSDLPVLLPEVEHVTPGRRARSFVSLYDALELDLTGKCNKVSVAKLSYDRENDARR